MTDKELIRLLREDAEGYTSIGLSHTAQRHSETADRLEALLAENERLKAGKDTNVPTSTEGVE